MLELVTERTLRLRFRFSSTVIFLECYLNGSKHLNWKVYFNMFILVSSFKNGKFANYPEEVKSWKGRQAFGALRVSRITLSKGGN